jgi:hypothetical protein
MGWGLPSGVCCSERQEALLHLALAAALVLGGMYGRPVFAIAVPLEVKGRKAANVAHTFHSDRVLPHKTQDGT